LLFPQDWKASMGSGDKTVAQRLNELEQRHAPDGACEHNRVQLWKAVSDMRVRLERLETTGRTLRWVFGIGMAVFSVVGPILAAIVVKKLGL
jgi:hypothetical protein